MKNIDKIRQMSAEELAQELLPPHCECEYCIIEADCNHVVGNCYDKISTWLNQEQNPLPPFEIADVIETVNNRYVVIWKNTVIGVKGIHSTTIPAYICCVDDVLAHETVTTIWRHNPKEKLFEKIWGADDE